MKVTTAGKNLFQLTQWGMMNCYLVREDDGFTLIDTTIGGQGPSIIKAAQQLGLPIARIVLTHAHADHVGALDELHKALPDLPVIISARDARFLAGEKSLDPDEPVDVLRGGYTPCETKPTVLLHDGDMVGSLRAVFTPGHTPGHMAFLDTRDNSLIAGDAYQTLGAVAVSGTLTIFPLPAMATWHKPLCLESARKLAALQPSLLAVGHGRVIQQPQQAMERAIAVMQKSLARSK